MSHILLRSLSFANLSAHSTYRGWKVFFVWEACINLPHAQHLVLLEGIIVVTNLKTISQTENDLKIIYCIQFLICYYKKENDYRPSLSVPLNRDYVGHLCVVYLCYSLNGPRGGNSSHNFSSAKFHLDH